MRREMIAHIIFKYQSLRASSRQADV